jgi:dihydroneopterin aldolase
MLEKNKLFSQLYIQSLELNLHLGWSDKERGQAQTVFLDLNIHFPAPPIAANTDDLNDTICYDKLIENIREKILPKQYRLIEHLSADIYAVAKKILPRDYKIIVRLSKQPSISGLKGGVSFLYGDE